MENVAFRELKAARANGERILFVHYACGNFYDSPYQHTSIACIAVSERGTQGEKSCFSVIDAPQDKSPEDREKDLLQRFYNEMRSHPDARVVHWNMNSSAFGFTAIASRYRYLFGSDAPSVPAPDRRFDLDEITKERFGKGYAGHPKLRQLCNLNGMFMPHFMLGPEEAAAISRGEFGPVVNSTTEKVHLISQIFEALCSGTLKTLNSVGWVSFAGEQVDAVAAVIRLAERMRVVSLDLRRRHDKRDTLVLKDEYDAQDLFRSLLRIFFDDIRVEDPASQVAGASTRIDFVLPAVGLAIELKYTRDNMNSKSLGEELIVDRKRYEGRGKISHLLFLVFDHKDEIINPRGIEADLSREKSESDFAVTVRILEQ
jgi:hypothetical protein